MKRIFAALLMLLMALWLTAGAGEGTEVPSLQDAGLPLGIHDLHWPTLTGLDDPARQQRINEEIKAAGGIPGLVERLNQILGYSSLSGLRSGWEGGVWGDILSLRLWASGPLISRRNEWRQTCLTWDLTLDRAVTWGDLFHDPEAAAAWMEEAIEEQIVPSLSGYLENAALLPLPEEWWMDARGLTLCYAAERYLTLSERPGTVCFTWPELAELLRQDEGSLPLRLGLLKHKPEEEVLRAMGEDASLPGLPVRLGEDMSALIDAWGLLHDPDLCEGGRLVRLEDDRFRGVWLLTDGLNRGWEGSVVTGIRADRGSFGGLVPGTTRREEYREALGAPDAAVTLSPEDAEAWRLEAGTDDYYLLQGATLRLHCGTDGALTSIFLMAD